LGTAGTDSGIESPTSPNRSTTKKTAIWATISPCTRPGRRSEGNAVSASRPTPAGTERPPASAITPFGPTMKPGVASACTANSAVMVENAIPISTLRPSRARPPAMLSASDASEAIAAAALTSPKCTCALIIQWRDPNAATTATGANAASSATARTIRVPGMVR
jgi:hypothetical protein